MASLMREVIYLLLSGIVGCHAAVTGAIFVTGRYNGPSIVTPTYQAYFPLWSLIISAPLFAIVNSKFSLLRNSRVNGCDFAIVYPHRDPILGIDWLVKIRKAFKEHRLMQTWDRAFREIGNTYWVKSTPTWVLMTNEPENVKMILSGKFEDWPIGGVRQAASVMSLGPHAILSVNGKEWQQSRAMIRPSFVRDQLADLECTERHVINLLARIPKDGSNVDLQELFFRFTMDVSTDFMFGHSTNTLSNPTEESLKFMEGFDYVLHHVSGRGRMGWLALLRPDKKFTENVKMYQAFVDRHVAKTLALGKAKERDYIFMNAMIDTGAPHEYIRDQLLAIILGGRDTSASTMSSTFYVLARRPDIVCKMRAEIAQLEGRRPTWEELKELKYVNMVLKETLRLWPPVPSNLRCANKDTVLPKGGGPDGHSPLFVPKGTSCRWSSYSLHRRQEVFGEDAEEFRPERWEKLRTSWEYIPISGGPRICIGQQFALTLMTYLITRMLQEFKEVEARDDSPMHLKIGTTLSLINGCWVALKAA